MADAKDEAVIIAYGANLTLQGLTTSQAFTAVVKSLEAQEMRVLQASRLWRSKAWPDERDPPYFNAVMRVATEASPEDVLARLHAIEAGAGRDRGGARYAPRTLDLDLIAYGRRVSAGDLVLPHPRAHERGFVMGPLSEILPDWVHPVLGRTAAALYAEVTVGRDAQPV